MSKRRKFSPEFKQGAIEQVEGVQNSVSAIAALQADMVAQASGK